MAATRTPLPAPSEIAALVEELRGTYLPSKAGTRHLAGYGEQHQIAQQNFEAAKQMEARGEDLTDFVLLKLLPHSRTEGNLQRGAWVCLAPVITKDLRQWFEGAGWAQPGSWPAIAAAVWRFVRNCAEQPDRLEAEVAEFSGNPLTKGFQTGFLSPVLHALRPDQFALVNSKSRKALSWATGERYGADLSDYPAANRALLAFVENHRQTFSLPGLSPLDSFDLFSHWLIGVKTLPLNDLPKTGWAGLVHWAGRIHEQEWFDAEERDYKLRVAENLGIARNALTSGADWLAPLKKALGPPNNLTGWQLNDSFIKWCGTSPLSAAATLAAIWSAEFEPRERFRRFFAGLPKELVSAPGGRIALGSLLHTAMDPLAFPVYRATPFKKGYGLTGYPHPPKDASELEVYEHALGFLDRFIEESARQDLQLRDRLDAQGVLWTVARAQAQAVEFMTADERTRFYEFVGAAPSAPRYWKIAPGENACQWKDCLSGGFIGIGWESLGDLSAFTSEEFAEHLGKLCELDPKLKPQGANQAWVFSRIQVGDRVVANRGTKEVIGIGTVTGPYHFETDVPYGHRLPVRWDDTSVRQVSKPGWKKTLIELTENEFAEIVNAEGSNAGSAGPVFDAQAFALLALLREHPTKDTYLARKDDYKSRIELPLKTLFRTVVSKLPLPILELLETHENVQSKFLKNDWGRDGAWPHLWAAAYPKGSSRIHGAQLYIAVEAEHLESGFHLEDNSSDLRKMLKANFERYGQELKQEFLAFWAGKNLLFGDRSAATAPEFGADASAWLDNLIQTGGAKGRTIRAGRSWKPAELQGLKLEPLAAAIAEVFVALFPLILMSSNDDPRAAVRKYLQDRTTDIGEEFLSPSRLGTNPVAPSSAPEHPLSEIAGETWLPESRLETWVRSIERKGQAIIYGPPGTGKTFVARKLAAHLIGGGDGFVELLQFHPSYAYEDFIQGLRPVGSDEGAVRFEVVQGRFLEFCKRAEAAKGRCVLILDEINRANLSRVFGELMYLLEYRDEHVALAGGMDFRIPRNVRVLGTMNTADRSIALVDHALRRRFAFLALRPEFDVLRGYFAGTDYSPEGLIAVLERVNAEIVDQNYAIGISFFLVSDPVGELEHIWRMEIEPYLEEIFFDQPKKLERFRWNALVKDVIGR